MRLNESENAEVVDISEIPLDYDAIDEAVEENDSLSDI